MALIKQEFILSVLGPAKVEIEEQSIETDCKKVISYDYTLNGSFPMRHDENALHQCNYCGKNFSKKNNLTKH